MVNWTKKAQQATAQLLEPGEQVRAGANLTGQQFAVTNGGFTGGLVAGGVAGAAAGATWDKHLEKARAAEEASRSKSPEEQLPIRDVTIPDNGALAVVTNHRLILFGLSAMSKPREAFFQVPLDQITGVHTRDVEQKLTKGMPGSRQIVLSFRDGTILPVYALSGGLNRKWVDGFVAALPVAAAQL